MSITRRTALVMTGAGLIAPSFAMAAARVPFQLVNGKIFVPATINGHAAETVLDSGSVFSGLDRAFAKTIGVAASGLPNIISGANAKTLGRYSEKVELKIAGYRVPNLSMLVLDYTTLTETVGNVIEAMIGADVFAAFVVDIDFAAKTLAFHPRAEFSPPRDAMLLALQSRNRTVTAPILVEGKPMQALVDTGSDSPLIVSPAPATAAGLTRGRKVSTMVLGGVGGSSSGRITSAHKVSLAGATFNHVPVQISARSLGHDANLGLGVLSRFHVWLDLTGRRMWLKPNGDERPFERNTIGFYGRIAPEFIEITHVAAGGPAAAAGLKRGDRIVKINGKPAADANFELSAAPVGTRLALTLGNGRTLNLTMAEYY